VRRPNNGWLRLELTMREVSDGSVVVTQLPAWLSVCAVCGVTDGAWCADFCHVLNMRHRPLKSLERCFIPAAAYHFCKVLAVV
jgi:hypothetical protein